MTVQLLVVIAHDQLYIRRMPRAPVPESYPLPLLADPTSTVSATYGTAFHQNLHGFWSNRQLTFVIDRDGMIRERFEGDSPQLSCLRQVSELRDAAKRLKHSNGRPKSSAHSSEFVK